MRTLGITVFVLAGTMAAFTPATQASSSPASNAQQGSGYDAGDHDSVCSMATLQGGFGFTSEGTLLALPAPFAGPFGEAGRQRFDGHGDTDGAATLSANGNIVKVTVKGTYLVNPDCTGSMALFVLPFGATVNLDFVIDDDGGELRAIATDAGSVETRVYRKQFSRGREE